MTKEVENIAFLLDDDKNLCFSVKYYDSSLNVNVIAPPNTDNSGKKKFLDAIRKAKMLGLEDVVVDLFEKKDGRCSSKPRISRKIRIDEPKPVSVDLLGDIGGLQGYIQTSVAVESVRKENDFLRRENQRLIDENRALKDDNRVLKEKIEKLKDQITELKWKIREQDLKSQNSLFNKLGQVGLAMLGLPIQNDNNNGTNTVGNIHSNIPAYQKQTDNQQFYAADKQNIDQFFRGANQFNGSKIFDAGQRPVQDVRRDESVNTGQSQSAGNSENDSVSQKSNSTAKEPA